MIVFQDLLRGIRFYIAVAIAIIVIGASLYVLAVYGNTTLALIRAGQIFGWLSLLFVAVALLIGPFLKLFPAIVYKQMYFESRRMFGIGAAVFALAHVIINYIILFDAANIFSLSAQYQQAFFIGFVALAILAAMALTSFDGAFRAMGIWWLRLHRLVYPAGLLILLHSFMVGTHAAQPLALILISLCLIVLMTAHIIAAVHKNTPTFWQIITISYSLFFLLAIMNYGLTQQLGYNPIEALHESEGTSH